MKQNAPKISIKNIITLFEEREKKRKEKEKEHEIEKENKENINISEENGNLNISNEEKNINININKGNENKINIVEEKIEENNININEEKDNENKINNNEEKDNENKINVIDEKNNNISDEKGKKEKIISEESEKERKRKNTFYSAEVKKYLKINAQDDNYSEIIKNNPKYLFSGIDNLKLAMMEANLYRFKSPSGKAFNEDILSIKLDRKEQNIIKNDCKRTRVREAILVPDFKETLEKIITFYCNSKDVYYKQGLNEIFGPLLLLRYKFPSLKLSKIFDLGEVFIDKFLPNYFYEKEFFSLKCALSLFVILLRYHEPSVYNRLDSLEILPEMYATNWVMTFLSAKIKLDVIYDFWEEVINTGDELILHFILVSLIKLKREMIINCDTNLLPGLMTSLTIQKKDELKQIMETALELRAQTPYSFRILANKIGFLKTNNKDIKKTFEEYNPQSIPAMPIFPLEILSLTFECGVECIDPECKNNKKKIALSKLDNTEYCIIEHEEIKSPILNFQNVLSYNHICEKCDMKIKKNIKYILLNLRILQYGGNENDDDLDKIGSLPNMIDVDQEELKSPNFSSVITDRFVPERGLYHFIFLTSNTDFYSEFENNFYRDNTSEEDKVKMMCGLLKQQKADKELNLEEALNFLTAKQIYTLKEYDNMRNTLQSMQKENFPYVGFVYGGFKAIHYESYLQDIELINHNEDKCFLCKEKNLKKKSKKNKKDEEIKKDQITNELWSSEKKIKFEELNILLKNSNNFVILCTIEEYKGKTVNYNASIALIDEKYMIEIYKFEQRKQYVDKQTDSYEEDIEQKKKNWIYYDLGKESNENNKNIELTLLEEIKITHILGLKTEPKNKNIMNITVVRDDIKDKKVNKKKGAEKYQIKIDFPSTNDSKNFITAFKKLTSKYKNLNKKNK